MNNFQTILVATFLAFFVFAVMIFSGILKIGSSGSTETKLAGKVVIWGTFDNSPELAKVFEDITTEYRDLLISYVKKTEATYEQSIVDAVARGTGPDLFIMSPEMILNNDSFIYKIPFQNYPQKTFRDSFIDGAEVYIASDGIVGFPIAVDPMVLYYNKDLLSNEGIVSPPAYWDELFELNAKLTKKKDDGTILQSMIALGQYGNVSHVKEILSMFLLQSNNPIVKVADGKYTATLNDDSSFLPISPVKQILDFFIEFSSPSEPAYSWNRSLPTSFDMFTGGKSAFYIGPASELFKIESVNPNLSFDVVQVLQTRGVPTKRTYGTIYAVAVNKKSANIAAAFGAAGLLSSSDSAKNLSAALSLPPALRSLLAVKPTDPYLFTFFNSSIISRAWLDPNARQSNSIFAELVENILSNKLSVDDAISKANGQLQSILQ